MTKLPEIVEAILEDLSELVEKAKAIDKWNIESIQVIWELIVEVIAAVEKYSVELGKISKEDKREIAVDTLNSLIDIPYMPEWLEGRVFGFAIDGAIQLLNRFVGKDWLSKK